MYREEEVEMRWGLSKVVTSPYLYRALGERVDGRRETRNAVTCGFAPDLSTLRRDVGAKVASDLRVRSKTA